MLLTTGELYYTFHFVSIYTMITYEYVNSRY